MALFGKSVRSAVMKVIETQIAEAQKAFDHKCNMMDEQVKVAKANAFDETVGQFTKLFTNNQERK